MSSHYATHVAKWLLGAANMGSNAMPNGSWYVQYLASLIDGCIDLAAEQSGPHGVSKAAFIIFFAKRNIPLLAGPYMTDNRLLLIPAIALLGISVAAAPVAVAAGGAAMIFAGLELLCNLYPVVVGGQEVYLNETRKWRVSNQMKQMELQRLIREYAAAHRATNAIRRYGPR